MEKILDIKIVNSTNKKMREKYAKFLFKKMQRDQGLLERDCDRMIEMTELFGHHVWLNVEMQMQW